MNHKILVVDDEKINFKLIEKIIGLDEFNIDFVTSGEECLKVITEKSYVLVLLDVHMGGIDGFSTCKQLHKILPRLPVIIMTASTEADSIKKAFESTATDYVTKPLRKVELLARINSVITIYQNEEKIRKLYDDIMKDLELASRMQSYIIPEQIVFNKNLLLSSVYQPSVKVSGDIFDIIEINKDEYVFYIGDISGHGIKSALLMTAVRASIRMLVEMNKTHIEPHDIVNKLNQSMCETFFKDNYITLLLGKIDLKNKTFEYCNAGHPPVIEHKLKTGETILLEDEGDLPVGWMKDYEYKESSTNNIQFDSNSLLFFYTDGIIECEDQNGDDLDLLGLIKGIGKFASVENIATLPHLLYQDLLDQQYKLNGDDITFVTLKYRDDLLSATSPQYFYYKVEPSLSEISIVTRKCEIAIKQHIKNDMLAAKVELALVEILNNIVVHGLNDKTRHNISITIEMIIFDDISIKIWDCGDTWSPEFQTPQNNIENIDKKNDEFATSGRGIDILREIVDEFHINHYEGLNETVLIFKI